MHVEDGLWASLLDLCADEQGSPALPQEIHDAGNKKMRGFWYGNTQMRAFLLPVKLNVIRLYWQFFIRSVTK